MIWTISTPNYIVGTHIIFSYFFTKNVVGTGRPKMTWKQLTERDCRERKLLAINPHDRHTWRSGARSAMRAASHLSGRGPPMWMLPLYLHVNQKSDYDDMMYSLKVSH